MKVLFVSSSNSERSPALVKRFSEKKPNHTYSSVGTSKLFCQRKQTTLISQQDIDENDLLVFVEDVHFDLVSTRFNISDKKTIVLNCGEFKRGMENDEYLNSAESILSEVL